MADFFANLNKASTKTTKTAGGDFFANAGLAPITAAPYQENNVPPVSAVDKVNQAIDKHLGDNFFSNIVKGVADIPVGLATHPVDTVRNFAGGILSPIESTLRTSVYGALNKSGILSDEKYNRIMEGEKNGTNPTLSSFISGHEGEGVGISSADPNFWRRYAGNVAQSVLAVAAPELAGAEAPIATKILASTGMGSVFGLGQAAASPEENPDYAKSIAQGLGAGLVLEGGLEGVKAGIKGISKTPETEGFKAPGEELPKVAEEMNVKPLEPTVKNNISGEEFKIIESGEETTKIESLKTGETLNINNKDLSNKFSPQDTPNLVPSGEAQRTISKLEQAGIPITEGEVPTYSQRPQNQIRQEVVSPFVRDNYELSKQILLGEKQLPEDLLNQRVEIGDIRNEFIKEARKINDYEAISDVARSENLADIAARAGQQVKSFDMDIGDMENPIKIINNIETANLEALKKYKGKTIDKQITKEKEGFKKESDIIKKEIKKNIQKKQTLEEFINSIKC